MKTNEAKGKVIKLLEKNGYVVKDMIVTQSPDDFQRPMDVRNKLSDIQFVNADGNDCVYTLTQIGSVLKLVEVEI